MPVANLSFCRSRQVGEYRVPDAVMKKGVLGNWFKNWSFWNWTTLYDWYVNKSSCTCFVEKYYHKHLKMENLKQNNCGWFSGKFVLERSLQSNLKVLHSEWFGLITPVLTIILLFIYSNTPIYRAPLYRVPRFTGLQLYPKL